MTIEIDQSNDVTTILYRQKTIPTKTGWYYARRVPGSEIQPVFLYCTGPDWLDKPNYEFFGPVPDCKERF